MRSVNAASRPPRGRRGWHNGCWTAGHSRRAEEVSGTCRHRNPAVRRRRDPAPPAPPTGSAPPPASTGPPLPRPCPTGATGSIPTTGANRIIVDPSRRADVLFRVRRDEDHEVSAWWMVGAFVAVSAAVIVLLSFVPGGSERG